MRKPWFWARAGLEVSVGLGWYCNGNRRVWECGSMDLAGLHSAASMTAGFVHERNSPADSREVVALEWCRPADDLHEPASADGRTTRGGVSGGDGRRFHEPQPPPRACCRSGKGAAARMTAAEQGGREESDAALATAQADRGADGTTRHRPPPCRLPTPWRNNLQACSGPTGQVGSGLVCVCRW
jgi:hypothetical protein